MTTPSTPIATPPEPVGVRLTLYHLNVSVKGLSGRAEVVNYWVEAPTQCSAARHTAMRDEVVDILMIEQWRQPLPEGTAVTFSTTAECP
jgi:hypothetical protein